MEIRTACSPEATVSAAGGESTGSGHRRRYVVEGTNGTFTTTCHGNAITKFACETKTVAIGNSHSGPIAGYRNTGAVVPLPDFPCGRGGKCRDGACYFPPDEAGGDCALAPPPCILRYAHPEEPAPPASYCCLPGTGAAYHCSTMGQRDDCSLLSKLDGCDLVERPSDACYRF